MKQAEMKYFLISKCFNTSDWKVIVDFDSQEKDREKYIEKLEKEFMVITKGGKKQKTFLYAQLNRPDIYAEDSKNVYIIEVEGGDPKQKEQKIYSAIGQIIFSMIDKDLEVKQIQYGIAVPDNVSWIKVLERIPKVNVRQRLNLFIYLVSGEGDVRIIQPIDEIVNIK